MTQISEADLDSFCAELRARIEEFYDAHGYDIGWRLLASPASTLRTADIAFIALNPGGNRIYEDHPDLCMKPGESAYRDEEWGGHARGQASLQKQVLTLFDKLAAAPEDVLSGDFVPFRSPSYAELKHKEKAEVFARELWRDIFNVAQPRLVIALGVPVFNHLHGILRCGATEYVSVDWPRVSARRAENDRCVLVGLPHLSRFRLMNREASAEGLNQLFKGFFA